MDTLECSQKKYVSMCGYVKHIMQHTQLVCGVGWKCFYTCTYIARVVASAFVVVPLPASAPVTGVGLPVVV